MIRPINTRHTSPTERVGLCVYNTAFLDTLLSILIRDFLCSLVELELTIFIDQTGIELTKIHPPLFPKCWNQRRCQHGQIFLRLYFVLRYFWFLLLLGFTYFFQHDLSFFIETGHIVLHRLEVGICCFL